MRHPNAFAASVSTQLALAIEEIVQKYAGANLGPFWSKEAVAVTAAIVLYVGKDGIKGALKNLVGAIKRVWSTPASPKPTTTGLL